MKKDEKIIIAIMVAMVVFVVILIAYGAYTGVLKPEVTEISKEENFEELGEKYETKLEAARRDTLDQHMQLVMVDNDALAVDLVYIDGHKHKNYVELLLGDNSWIDTEKRDYSPSTPLYKDSYDFDSDYTVEQFDELVRVFKHDENAKMLAASIVEEYYDDSDNDLTIPNRRMRQIIKNGLKSSNNKDDDGEDDVYNDKPHAPISKKPDEPKYDKN